MQIVIIKNLIALLKFPIPPMTSFNVALDAFFIKFFPPRTGNAVRTQPSAGCGFQADSSEAATGVNETATTGAGIKGKSSVF